MEQGADVGFVGPGDRIAFIDEGQEEAFLVSQAARFREGEQRERRRAECDAVDPFEAAREDVELRPRVLCEHVCVEQAGYGAAG